MLLPAGTRSGWHTLKGDKIEGGETIRLSDKTFCPRILVDSDRGGGGFVLY